MTIINSIIYILIVLVFVWGIKYAGFGKKFHEDFMSVEATRNFRGLAALLILMHHISQEGALRDASVIQIFYNIGPILVAVFFFCSGYGLIRSYDSNEDYLNGFIKKRIVIGILLPFYVNVILYGIFYLATGAKYKPVQWATKLTGLTLMNDQAWFPIALTIMYFVFYLTFKKVKNQKVCFAIILVVILLEGALFCIIGHFAWWVGKPNWWLSPFGFRKAAWWMQQHTFWFAGEWWVNSTIAFWIGLVFGRNSDAITSWFKSKYALKFIISLVLFVLFYALSEFCQAVFSYWSEYSGKGPGIGDKFICYGAQLLQITALIFFTFLLRMKIRISNPITRFFGKYSLHTYLMNRISMTIFSYLLLHKRVNFKIFRYKMLLFAIAVVVASALFGVIQERICRGIKRIAVRTEK